MLISALLYTHPHTCMLITARIHTQVASYQVNSTLTSFLAAMKFLAKLS